MTETVDDIFETNDLSRVQTYEVMGSTVYIMDDFYKHPHAVLRVIHDDFPKLWKASQGSQNGTAYFDRRNELEMDGIPPLMKKISKLISRRIDDHMFVTNLTKFVDKDYNDYRNNYWYPHRDEGYNGIVYLNDQLEEYSGTNLYHPDCPDATTDEGLEPWSDKSRWELVHTLRARFNRFVCFDGEKFPHAMCVEDDTFFGDFYRINQVLFFKSRFTLAEFLRLARRPRVIAKRVSRALARSF